MITSKSIYVAANGIISLYVYVPHLLYPLCRWTFRLLLCLDSCEQAAVNTGAHVSFLSFLDMYPRVELLDYMVTLFLVF